MNYSDRVALARIVHNEAARLRVLRTKQAARGQRHTANRTTEALNECHRLLDVLDADPTGLTKTGDPTP